MNNTTESLAAALSAFQSSMPSVPKSKRADVPTKSGGKYSYTYADLADVTAAAAPLLARNGLAFSSCPRQTERGYELVGILLHASGERLEGALPISGNTPQEMGSSLTYMRRYLLGCLTGIVTDDDDDGALAGRARKAPQSQRQERVPSRNETGEVISDAQLRALHAAFHDAGISTRESGLEYCSKLIGRPVETTKDLTRSEASKVIDALKQDANEKSQQ